jgi:hypothetical protein
MNRPFTILFVLLMLGCKARPDVDTYLRAEYDQKMISSGENRPKIGLGKDNLRDIIILLHHRVPSAVIREHFQWTDADLAERLDLLEENDFVRKRAPGVYVPGTMVITLGEGEELQASSMVIADEVADYIEENLSAIRSEYAAIPAFDGIPFRDAAFFILSDVILDNWQINFIERDFIRAERTLRHGVNYYHALQEKDTTSDHEAFSIFGNQMWGRGTLMAGVYGNKRTTARHLLSLKKKDLAEQFGMPDDADISEFRAALLETIVRRAYGELPEMAPEIQAGLEGLGIADASGILIPVLRLSDYEALSDMAATHTSGIVNILEAYRDDLRMDYERSRYSEEITFEEYLIWWYHFLYTEVTEQLALRGLLSIPSSGVVTYVVDWREYDPSTEKRSGK